MKKKIKISTIIKLSLVVLIVGGFVTLILNNKVYFGETDMQTFGTRNLEVKSKYAEITDGKKDLHAECKVIENNVKTKQKNKLKLELCFSNEQQILSINYTKKQTDKPTEVAKGAVLKIDNWFYIFDLNLKKYAMLPNTHFGSIINDQYTITDSINEYFSVKFETKEYYIYKSNLLYEFGSSSYESYYDTPYWGSFTNLTTSRESIAGHIEVKEKKNHLEYELSYKHTSYYSSEKYGTSSSNYTTKVNSKLKNSINRFQLYSLSKEKEVILNDLNNDAYTLVNYEEFKKTE